MGAVLAGIALQFPPTAPYISSLGASSRSNCKTLIAPIRTRPKRERPLGSDGWLEERLLEAAARRPNRVQFLRAGRDSDWDGLGSDLFRIRFGPGSELDLVTDCTWEEDAYI